MIGGSKRDIILSAFCRTDDELLSLECCDRSYNAEVTRNAAMI